MRKAKLELATVKGPRAAKMRDVLAPQVEQFKEAKAQIAEEEEDIPF
jgi:hypothetical protein